MALATRNYRRRSGLYAVQYVEVVLDRATQNL
jgi:hypothetical protein